MGLISRLIKKLRRKANSLSVAEFLPPRTLALDYELAANDIPLGVEATGLGVTIQWLEEHELTTAEPVISIETAIALSPQTIRIDFGAYYLEQSAYELKAYVRDLYQLDISYALGLRINPNASRATLEVMKRVDGVVELAKEFLPKQEIDPVEAAIKRLQKLAKGSLDCPRMEQSKQHRPCL